MKGKENVKLSPGKLYDTTLEDLTNKLVVFAASCWMLYVKKKGKKNGIVYTCLEGQRRQKGDGLY